MLPTTFNSFGTENERTYYHDNFTPQPLPPNCPQYEELEIDYPILFDDFTNIDEEATSFYNEFYYDTEDFPTKSYSYNFDGIAPEFEIVKQRTTSNNTIDTYYFYDGFANLVQIKTPSDISGQQIVKNLFYDGLFRIKEEQNPYFATFSINITNSSTTNKTKYQYDALSRPIKIINPDRTIKTTTYNKSIIDDYDENNNKHTYILDAYDRIIEVREYNKDFYIGDNEIYNTTYEYNTADELTKITDTYGNEFKFTYDSLGRKTKIDDPDLGTWSYTYDLASNLISQVGGGGNLVTGDSFYREYNGLGQLKSVKEGNNSNGRPLEEYFYDANNDRIKVIRYCYSSDCSNETIYTPYKEWMQIRNSSGTYNFHYVYQDNVLVSRLNPDGTKYFYHPDHLGSTTLITDENGNVVESEFYSPFGESLDPDNAEKFKLYTGQFKDTVGQYYYGARYYKPEWIVFVMADDTIPRIYSPQSFNRYAYGLNNPYAYLDPSGREPVRSQAGRASQVIAYIHSIEENNPKLSANQVLNTVALQYLQYESNQISNQQSSGFSPNFVYTKEHGVIDMRHFFANAVASRYFSEGNMRKAEWLIEKAQCVVQKHSCNTYEDPTSNRLGREFGRGLDEKDKLSEQFKNFAEGSKAQNFPSWLWSIMPQKENIGVMPPDWKKWYSGEGKGLPYGGGGGFIPGVGYVTSEGRTYPTTNPHFRPKPNVPRVIVR